MKRAYLAAAICLLFMSVPPAGRAQEAKGFRADLLGQMEYGQKEILDLENAIPEKKMTWRPNKEVRSISEVYSHIAFGNYLFGKFACFTLPEGVSVTSPADEKKWETMTTDKKAIHEQLVKSFAWVKDGINGMSDAGLETTVDFFGQKMTVRSVLLALLSHSHEHLGQSIAYARMEGIVPPWTAAQMAAEKAKK
ncbi:MAG TPA: DinB family protein [Bacteroidota bacterium]|nr:DinB family protein [Bacteroidota bacterium]